MELTVLSGVEAADDGAASVARRTDCKHVGDAVANGATC